jgi:GNAT superfamily N-acetyltransferase
MTMTMDASHAKAGNYGSITIHSLSHQDEADIRVLSSAGRKKLTRFLSALALVVGVAVTLLLLGVQVGLDQDKDRDVQTSLLGIEDRLPENTPQFYTEQPVDHFDNTKTTKDTDTWSHRYYAKSKYFQGPGHAIFLVVGGEGPNDRGMFYPFVNRYLASKFGAFVLHPEHRFYGLSQPLLNPTSEDLKKLLTLQQVMADMLKIAQHYRKKLGCSMERSSKRYCPLIAVGGSYPGFLSAIMRLVHSDLVDIAYASSAPLKLYARESHQFRYHDVIAKSAERASPGCAHAVKTTVTEVDKAIQRSVDFRKFATKTSGLNICSGSIPNYITTNDLFSKEVMQIVADTFADLNMDNYPPSNLTDLAQVCHIFQNESLDSFGKLAQLWARLEFNIDPALSCFNMSSQLPDGPNATISGSDWSGLGPGPTGKMWDFQCCTTLTPAVGFGKNSMFPYRKWSIEWLTHHCLERFNVTPKPFELVNEWKFNNLAKQGATRILFTNGLNDLWSAGSYLKSSSESIRVVNMPNGAHHSELYHTNDEDVDTDDVKRAHDEITDILSQWLDEIKSEQ